MKKTKYISFKEVREKWNTHAIGIEFSDGSDALAQENGYTLEQCEQMQDDVLFFLDKNYII